MSSQGKLLRLSSNNAEKDTVANRSSNILMLPAIFFFLTTNELWLTDHIQTLSKRARKFCFLSMSLFNIPLFISLFISQILIEDPLYAWFCAR